MKTCGKCRHLKSLDCFYQRRSGPQAGQFFSYCKPCKKGAQRRWQQGNLEKKRESYRRWYAANLEKGRETVRRWRRDNPDKMRESLRRYQAKKYATSGGKIEILLRCRLREVLKGAGVKKSARTLELLGMGLAEFKIYIQGQFRPGMAWENYGPVWHVDHVRPCASFDLTDPAQQRICFNWENLQPLFAKENLMKGAKYDNHV